MQELSAFFEHMNWDGLLNLFLRIIAVLICIVVHEVSHGFAAYKLGDPTAKAQHRLSLNPLRHIDPFGALMMLLVGFGWAKPVPVDMRYFKKPKLGMAITALAGPVSNFLLSYVLWLIAFFILGLSGGVLTSEFLWRLVDFIALVSSLSIGLGVFNLIPFPPLDGSKIFGAFLPDHIYAKVMKYEFAGTFVLMALLWLGVLDSPLYMARSWISDVLLRFAQWPYYLLT